MFKFADVEVLESIGAVGYIDGLRYKNNRRIGESKKCHVERILDEVRIRQIYETNGMYVIKTLYPKESIFTKRDSYVSQWDYMFGQT